MGQNNDRNRAMGRAARVVVSALMVRFPVLKGNVALFGDVGQHHWKGKPKGERSKAAVGRGDRMLGALYKGKYVHGATMEVNPLFHLNGVGALKVCGPGTATP
jgi:hypothetical protein